MASPDDREVTPPELYFNRRTLVRGGVLASSLAATGWVYRRLNVPSLDDVPTAPIGSVEPASSASPFRVNEPLTSFTNITHYNNFYEFSTDKDEVAEMVGGFSTTGWKIDIGGLVHRPTTLDMDALRRLAPLEERIYRMRCVEAWSMVIPWVGLPLARLLAHVEPLGSARYVAFETLHDPARFPGQKKRILDWPYVEGLRLDEAMHPLTLLATGLYGRELPTQDGAPVRLVVPWKYGFKGIKSIVKITLTADQPPSTWNRQAPDEYGFYANVNPQVDHPRWSQATEQRIGESKRRPTLPFNGYADEVASLYTGMDLRVLF